MAYFDEKSLKKHISSKKFNNIYVIFGDEKYLVKFYTKELVKAVAGTDPSEFAYHEFSGSADLNSLAAAIGVVPFMSEYNCVLVSDMDVSKLSKEDYDSLKELIKSVPDTTVLIFSYCAVVAKDKPSNNDEKKPRSRFKPFCDAVEKHGMGAVAEINMRTAVALEHQLAKWADKMGKKLSLPVASKIIYYSGTDLATLRFELDKLCAFAGESEEITIEMVDTIVIKKLEARVFDMVDNVIYGNTDKAYTQLYQLFAQREDPRGIVRLLGLAYVDLYRARVTTASGGNMKDTADFFKYGNRTWALNKAVKKADRLSTNALRESMGEIVSLNAKMNSTSMNEEAAVEKLIADLVLIAKRELDYA
ncbi:MAG: DNA polymerase III subunit delta [Clostridia bacterium]|nr:DNA polymerase III subunit delta [Clostridia bacterium]